MNLTQHAQQRMQQRGIPRQAIDYVLTYGRVSHDHRGACVVWLDKRSRARLGREAGRKVVREMDKHLDAYVVTDKDGTVMPVGHRYRRIRRH
jgi:pimeloyl-CoA synthetase